MRILMRAILLNKVTEALINKFRIAAQRSYNQSHCRLLTGHAIISDLLMMENDCTMRQSISKLHKDHGVMPSKLNCPKIFKLLKMGSQHELPLDTPILYLKCEEAFSGLTDREKKYAHHLGRASWWGHFVVMCQRSLEAPVLFSMFIKLFQAESIDSLKETAISKVDFTEDEFKNLLIYFSGFLYNSGNYIGFGDRKFIPTIPKNKLERLIRASKAYIDSPKIMEDYMTICMDLAYDLDEKKKFFGMPPQGVTMYFSPNCTDADANMIKEYMIAKNLEAWNSRLVKHEKDGQIIYDIRIASVEKGFASGITVENDEFKGHKICVSRGDYSFFLEKIVGELKEAKNYANSLEQEMFERYIESFTTGSIKAHKIGSGLWVKNKSPAIETYMGFIEVYSDPTHQRAEYESFVAMVNREQSRKFDVLVERAEKEFLPLLPWGKDFEEDVFMKPDFSALDILAFATAGLPIGINIPNYKDVKEEEGFKNVSLTNVMAARTGIKGGPFLCEEDHVLREKYGSISLEVDVALHELLGHGCGKFLRRKDDGSLNFDPEKVKNPFTGEAVTFYEIGQNYQTEFTSISSAYEECRAESVALYLNLVDEILDIFAIATEDKDNVKYVSWVDMLYAGLKGLELYQPSQKKWSQAHSQARYVILRVILEAGEGLVNFKEYTGSDGLPDLLMTVDRSKIDTVGRAAIGEFLKKLQVYRSMADSKNGVAMFEEYSKVPEDGPYPFAKWHEIVVRKRRPRMLLTMPNTRSSGNSVDLVCYPDGSEGCIQSWVERFSFSEYDIIEKELLRYVQSHNQ